MNLQQAIDELIRLLHEHSVLPAGLSAEAEVLRDRLTTGQLHLAVMGQFKRGKSTLINALLGGDILPSGVLPVTLVPVFLHFGSHPELAITYLNGHPPERCPIDRLGDFVNEAHNPNNARNVRQVDLFYPAHLLQNGIVLIDTPGVGSTLQHNTDTTLDFLPRCDAAIVVLSADPPITAAEVEFLQKLKPHVAQLLFVLNKIDYLDNGSAAEARQFLTDTLRRQAGIDAPQVVSVSARRGLQARLGVDEALWSESGMRELERMLLAFAREDKQTVLEEAVRRKATNLALEADQLVALEYQAMKIPLAELDLKIATFKRYAENAQQQRQEILDRVTGDVARLEGQVEEASEVLRGKARIELMKMAEALGLPSNDDGPVNDFHQEVRLFFDREKDVLGTRFREALRAALVERAQSALLVRENLRRDASSLLDVPHFSLFNEEIVVELTEPAWAIEHLPVPVKPDFGTSWLPRASRDQRYARQRQRVVEELTIRNVEKIRWWILRTIDDSMHGFRRKVTAELAETIQQIDRALQTGYQRQQFEIEDREAALNALVAYRARLQQVRQEIEGEVPTPIA